MSLNHSIVQGFERKGIGSYTLWGKQRLMLANFRRKAIAAVLRKRFYFIYRKYRHYTMIPTEIYVPNLLLAHQLRHVDGCVVECGVWRGGMIAGIAEVLGPHRAYFLFDSFQGLPPAEEIDGQVAIAWQTDIDSPTYYNNCTASEMEARTAMRLSKAAQYSIVRGWFEETLPHFKPPCPIALLRLDGDWYQSTRLCLEYLSPYLARNGIIIVDDYYTWDGCARAVHEFLGKTGDRRFATAEGVVVLSSFQYSWVFGEAWLQSTSSLSCSDPTRR
jgi:O-methyltransferase